MQRMFLLFLFLPFLCKFGYFLDFCPLTNVRISRFLNFENHVFLNQIQLVTPSMKTVLEDKFFGAKIKNKAVYTVISVACGWAGAVMSFCKPRNSEIRDKK